MKLFEICIILHEIYWIKSKPDLSIMKLDPDQLVYQLKNTDLAKNIHNAKLKLAIFVSNSY